MVGLLPVAGDAAGAAFSDGQAIGLLGVNTDEVGGSEYLATLHGLVAGRPPHLDAAREAAVGRACRRLVRAHLVTAAHDCSEGGLAVALAEACIAGARPVGATVRLEDELRPDLLLFGEAPSRILVAYPPEREAEVRQIAADEGALFAVLGATGGATLAIYGPAGRILGVPVAELRAAWQEGFAAIVS
jgi:phosphoribosylformylglycinamidine synthase